MITVDPKFVAGKMLERGQTSWSDEVEADRVLVDVLESHYDLQSKVAEELKKLSVKAQINRENNMDHKVTAAELRKRNRFVLATKVEASEMASMTPEEKEILKKFYGFQESDFGVGGADSEKGMKSQQKF